MPFEISSMIDNGCEVLLKFTSNFLHALSRVHVARENAKLGIDSGGKLWTLVV
jgi:hypothetical protein